MKLNCWHFCALPLFLYYSLTELNGAVFAVNAGGGGNFTTIQACANAAAPGDSCIVYAGKYDEIVVVPTSGAPSLPITFQAASGEAVQVRGFTLTGRRHIVIGGPAKSTGFDITGGSSLVTLNFVEYVTIQGNYIHHGGVACIRFGFNTTSRYVIIQGNTIEWCGDPPSNPADAIQLRGDHILVQDNLIAHVSDFITAYGVSDLVIRRNTFGPMSDRDFPGTSNPLHVDGLYAACLSSRPSDRILVESNTMSEIDVVDSHFTLFENDNSSLCGNTVITRYNVVTRVGGPHAAISQRNGYANAKFYNNTFAHTGLRLKGKTIINFQRSPNGAVINNLFYYSTDDGASGYGLDADSLPGFLGQHNLAFNTCGTNCKWSSPIASELGGIRNQDPLFVSSSDYRLQTNSPARRAGTHLTTVSPADFGSGTSLIAEDAAFFQDGSGIVDADWIRIGDGTPVQIESIDHRTNTIVLKAPTERAVNAPIYLYKDSSARTVLLGSQPDIGAYQHVGAYQESTPAPAVNLKVTVR